MANLENGFDASQVDPTMGGRAFPIGKHKVVITKSDAKPTKAGDGGLAEFVFRIIEGGAAGHEGIGDRLNLWNPDAQAVEIARKRLSAYCWVTNQLRIQATEQLHNIPFYAEWQLQKGEEATKKGYTELVAMWDVNGNEPGKQGQNHQINQQAPTASNAWGGQQNANPQVNAAQAGTVATQQGNTGGWVPPSGNANAGGAADTKKAPWIK